jgi:hypothetical protein
MVLGSGAARGDRPGARLRRALAAALAAAGIAGFTAIAGWESRLAAFGDSHVIGWGLSGVAAIGLARVAWLVVGAVRAPAPRLDPFA